MRERKREKERGREIQREGDAKKAGGETQR